MTGMTKVLISFDPALLATIDRMAKERCQSRAELVRDMAYTIVWQEKKTARRVHLRRAPTLPSRVIDDPNENRVIRLVGECHQSVAVDKFGLAIDPPKHDTPWGQEE